MPTLKDKIPGGLADKMSPKDFNPKALQEGTKAEMEHTSDPNIALEIAMDHLMEDPEYYTKLEKMESGPNLSHKELLPVINRVRQKIKESEVLQKMCEEYGVGVDYIDLIPMCFQDLSVSARTDKGCIYYNVKLLEDGGFEKDDHYMVHEIRHHFQQCHGDGPTEAPTKDNYLDNECEQEGFRDQTEYLSETRNDHEAEKYLEKVLNHHEVPHVERKKRRKELLQLAQLIT